MVEVSVEHRLGELSAQVKNMKEDMEEMKVSVSAIRDIVVAGKGAGWALVKLGGLAIAAIGAIGTFFHWWSFK